jgi:2,4-dienoyl-CoA reductase (NADPH2)
VGAGPAGLACAVTATSRGHRVTLYEAGKHIGGQFRLAMEIPGEEEFVENLRYYISQLELNKVELKLGSKPAALDLKSFDAVVLSTGVVPRIPDIPGIQGDNVAPYSEILSGEKVCGPRVAIVGAGGIGFDLAAYLLHEEDDRGDVQRFMAEWGVDMQYAGEGGLTQIEKHKPAREIYLLQRKKTKLGLGLGKTTGWIHRSHLKKTGSRC